MKKHLQPSLASIQLRLRRTSLHPLFLLLSLIFFLLSSSALAEIRYVSKTSSSTPPYTSWETAADSIQKCIDISQFGDTIYVANGIYKEQVVMIPGLSLIGAGMDSCVIDTRDFNNPQAINVKSNSYLTGFKIIVQNSFHSLGAGIVITGNNSIIEFNEVINARSEGIWCYDTNSIIRKNRVVYCDDCIQIEFNQPFIYDNDIYVVTGGGAGILMAMGSNPVIHNNLITVNHAQAFGIRSAFNEGAVIKNNLILGNKTNHGWYGIFSYNDQKINNLISIFFDYSMLTAGGTVKNNNVSRTMIGLYYDAGSGLPEPEVKYNNWWKNETNFQNIEVDSTNIFADPMFVDKDSLDFHLQMFSPLIDAGDPDILDKDGSRSDIGLFGGPYGEKYTYRDLAPKPPSNLTAQYDSGLVKLTWNRNTEADFFHYRVYRDTVPDFMYDTTKIIAVLPDTIYYDELPEIYLAGNYYYKVTALDSTGHQSAPGEEVHINITGVPEGPPVVVEHYQLLNNYPNPFNPSTIIPYRLIEPGYVKLYIYDIKGELVRILVNEYQNRGYYEVEFRPGVGEREQGEIGLEYWTGYNDDIASGIYIYQLMVKGEGNIPVFTGMGKMILLK